MGILDSTAAGGVLGPTADNAVAVIVSLDPESDVLHHVDALTGQVARIVVIDNGSGPDAASTLDSLAALSFVEVIRNPVNAGIARALNQGAQAAVEAGAGWLLTLDQDTVPGPEIVRIAGRTFEACAGPRPIALIGSASAADPSRPTAPERRGRPWADASYVITSGSLVSLSAWRAVGGFRDDLFVDYVDIEFCLRARARGYRVLASRTPAMTHQVGRPTVRWIGGRAVKTTNHSAARRYYITRNRIFVWRRYWRTDTRFVVRDMIVSRIELLKLMLFEHDRVAKLRAMLTGAMDGMRGISGRRRVASGPPLRTRTGPR